jgi:hypothetical protein
MSQVVFFSSSGQTTGRPLGMYRLASHLRNKEITVKCLWSWDETSDQIWYKTMKHHVSKDTLVVGISATVMARSQSNGQLNFFGVSDQEFKARCKAIKERAPACKIIVGGGQVQFADVFWLKSFECVDYFASGQGEALLTYLLECLIQGTRPKLSDITKPYLVSDRDVPFQGFNTSITLWQPQDAVRHGEPLPLELARGCIFSCSFCSYDLIGKKPQDFVRQKTMIQQELVHNYQQFGTDTYYVSDDLLNESDYKIDLLYDVAQSLPFKIRLSGYLRLDLVRRWPLAFKKLLDSGLYSAFFGIETLNDRSGRAVGKGLGKDRTLEALQVITDMCGDQFIGQAGIILGLPYDTPDTCYDILEWSVDPLVQKVIKSLWINPLFINTRNGGSDIDKKPADFGYQIHARNPSSIQLLNTDKWQTNTYDSDSAQRDALWLKQKLNETNPWSSVCNPWVLPWVSWLDHDNRDVLFQNISKQSNKSSFDPWFKNILEKNRQSHINYLRMMVDAN